MPVVLPLTSNGSQQPKETEKMRKIWWKIKKKNSVLTVNAVRFAIKAAVISRIVTHGVATRASIRTLCASEAQSASARFCAKVA